MPLPTIIPTSRTQRWREFRMQIIPAVVFCLVLCLAAVIWKTDIFPGALVGRVETVQANVASAKAGWITQLHVARLQKVAQGEPVAEVTITPPNVLTASLAVIRAEIEHIRVSMMPAMHPEQQAINYDQLRLGWLRQQVELASSKVHLQFASSELLRCEKLFRDKLISDSEYDAAKARKNALQAEVNEQTRLVAELQQTVETVGASVGAMQSPKNQLQAAIAVEEEKLRLTEEELKPIILKAPQAGTVNLISRWQGETVAPGDTIMTIGADQTQRIVGYLRQPLFLTPKTNMLVQIRTRGLKRLTGFGRILAVGGQLQSINDGLLPPTKYNVAEQGLPILVSLPEELKSKPGEDRKVYPGELVDIRILPGN